MWIKVGRLEVVLREVHVPGDCPQLQTEDLAAVLELLVGALTVDLTGQLSSQDIRPCREHGRLANITDGGRMVGWVGIISYQTIFSIELLKLPLPRPPT